MRRRPNEYTMPGIVPTLQAILDDFEDWQAQPDDPELPPVMYRVLYLFIGADKVRREVKLEQLKGTGAGNPDDPWPKPGFYEIHVLNQEGQDLVTPWRAEHVTNEMMLRRPEESTAALLSTIQEESRIVIFQQRARATEAERNEQKMREELRAAIKRQDELTRENAGLTLSAEDADRRMKIAEGRYKQLEKDYQGLEDSIASLRPQIQMFVDAGFQKLAHAIGLPIDVSNDTSSQNNPEQQDWDPPPPGAEDPDARADEFMLLILDPRRLRSLVEAGFLTWSQARALVWMRTKRTLPEWHVWIANWDDFVAAWDEAYGTTQGQEKVA